MSDKLTKTQIEKLRKVLCEYWERAGHCTDVPNALCDAALANQEDAERYRWMKENVKRIPPGWARIGWDAAIDAARKEQGNG